MYATVDTSNLFEQHREFAQELKDFSADLIDERVGSLFESCTTIETTRNPEELDLVLESSLITLEEQANFFEEVLREFQLELLRREESIIEYFWQIAEKRLDPEPEELSIFPEAEIQVEEEVSETPLPPPVKKPINSIEEPVINSDAGVDTFECLISESKKLLEQRKGAAPSPEIVQSQLDNVNAHIRNLTLDWYRLNASATNQQERREAADFKDKIDSLHSWVKKLEALLKRTQKNASKVPAEDLYSPRVKTHPNQSGERRSSGQRTQTKRQSVPEGLIPAKHNHANHPVVKQEIGRKFSLEYFEFLESDYFKYRSLWNHFFKDIRTDAERKRLSKLKDILAQRRADLSQWRDEQSFLNENPVSLKTHFVNLQTSSTQSRTLESTEERVRKILRDLKKNPGHRQHVKGAHALNRKVFLTAGRINPRARP